MPIYEPISQLNIGLYLYAVPVTLTLPVGALTDLSTNRLYIKLFIALPVDIIMFVLCHGEITKRLAEQLLTIHPEMNIIFCTGHSEYAAE